MTETVLGFLRTPRSIPRTLTRLVLIESRDMPPSPFLRPAGWVTDMAGYIYSPLPCQRHVCHSHLRLEIAVGPPGFACPELAEGNQGRKSYAGLLVCC
jgi:hypothetical protein